MDVGSDLWFSWLKEPDVRSFHFESEAGKFTARKEQRPTSTNEYWYAYRKIQGKLRKIYLGPMDELTEVRLNQVAAEISQDGWDYYSSRKSYAASLASKEQNSMTASRDSTLTLTDNGYPIKDVVSCVTGSELEALKSEAALLRSQLAEVTTELDQERAEKNDWVDSAVQWQSIAIQIQKGCQALRLELEQSSKQLVEATTELDQERAQKNSWMDSANQWQSIAEQVQEECQHRRKSFTEVDLASEPNGYPIKELDCCVTNSELELAADILRQALTLKPNAGGAIKEKIREALSKLQQSQ